MLPSPHFRPLPQPSEQQHLPTYLEAQRLLQQAQTSFLLQSQQPIIPVDTPLLNLYTPYRAHDSAPQIPLSLPQGALQEDLLRRKTPAGILPDSYNGAPVEWFRRPTKHILLPISTGDYTSQLQANSFPKSASGASGVIGLPQPAVARSMPPPTFHPDQPTWPLLNADLWVNSGYQIPINGGLLGAQCQTDLLQSQGVLGQADQLYHNGLITSQLNLNQQPSIPLHGTNVREGLTVSGIGMRSLLNQDGGYFVTNSNIMSSPDGSITLQPQSYNPAYLINASPNPPLAGEFQSFINSCSAWNQQYRGNSGQAQTFQTIDAPSTSPYPIASYQPFIADPIHHIHGYDGLNNAVSTNFLHNTSNRNRILFWAHQVYADLVQSTQNSKVGSQIVSSPAVQHTSIGVSQHRLSHHQLSPSGLNSNRATPVPQVNDPTDDNHDRRKRRRIDNVVDIYPLPPHLRKLKKTTPSSYSPKEFSSGSVTQVGGSNLQEFSLLQGHNSFHGVSEAYQFNNISTLHQFNQSANEVKGAVHSLDTTRNLFDSAAMINAGICLNGTHPTLVRNRRLDPSAAKMAAYHALDIMQQLCVESGWRWLDGMLLGGCIAYALGDLNRALGWYLMIVEVDSTHVEALSNLGATLLALGRRSEAEEYWLRAVKAKPNYFEAVEHLIGLLCGEQRGMDAVALIEFVERSVKRRSTLLHLDMCNMSVCSSSSGCSKASISQSSSPGMNFEYDEDEEPLTPIPPLSGQSEFIVSPADNGRLLGLIHTKGNILYTLGDNAGAAKAFEDAVLIGAGGGKHGIKGLMQRILDILSPGTENSRNRGRGTLPILLTPEKALKTAQLVFPPNGELPGLREIQSGSTRKIAISTTSNSLLSLAKIFQDGMSSSSGGSGLISAGVKDILALYYLSLSLHPSPSTANNVGILLASVHQTTPISNIPETPMIPGYTLGSGVGLALLYYQYGLMLDARHAHLYTNLGSLLKDINNLPMAIKMYEQAVLCDGTFDIALANLANAVKDQGRTSEAIKYYRRAVVVNPNFAEAVCGLANALNSVCDWKGRGGVVRDRGGLDRWHVNEDGTLLDAKTPGSMNRGWVGRVVGIVEKQLEEGKHWGKGILMGNVMETLLREVAIAVGGSWSEERSAAFRKMVATWAGKKNEGQKVVRLIERAIRRAGWRWYHEKHIKKAQQSIDSYLRPTLPACLSIPSAPTVLPFHTFTCPLSAQQVRQISQRNGIRISCSTLRAPWVSLHVYPPPAPPSPHLNVGYISSDFNNHPLAHLMQSVFGMHDPSRIKAHCYATTPSDNSLHRLQIEREAPVFYDTSCWGPDQLINQIIKDGIHILVNLNGFTRGAKNEIFAARPAPIQMSFMGFAGSLGADWCDYLLADSTAIPPETLRPWRKNMEVEHDGHEADEDGDWVYSENIVFTKHSFFCCDHRQSAPDAKGPRLPWEDELQRRWKQRKELFPDLPDDAVILGNFNQLYKIEPTTFRTWLRIIAKVPNARLWLLRFPDLGEKNLRELAEKWAGPEVAKRMMFTDVAPKQQHIARARVCDIFLDTPECNAHTTAADVTWSGTPLLTLPRHKYKMCSRIAASIVRAAVPPTENGKQIAEKLIAVSEEDYEKRAVAFASALRYEAGGNGAATGELMDIRRVLYEGRWTSPLFDTRRWVRDLETAYELTWSRWVDGEGGDIWL